MQILSAEQIRQWDLFTIEKEPIASVELMERAAQSCVRWLEENKFAESSICIFCGKGNNGGDGLAIARLLSEKAVKVIVYILEFGHKGTPEFQMNLARLHLSGVDIRFVQSSENLHEPENHEIFIDALYGTGLNRPLDGLSASVIQHINRCQNTVVAIDIPSGMFTDKSSVNNVMVRATHTLSFQCFKPAFLVAENASYVGNLHILDIGLLPEYLQTIQQDQKMTDLEFIRSIYAPRLPFAHKGNFGHALLVAGSTGKYGAVVLAAKAAVRTGAGLVTCRIPQRGLPIVQTAVPEVMVDCDPEDNIITGLPKNLETYKAIGVGPGLGTESKTAQSLGTLLSANKRPLVLDADALNILSTNGEWLNQLPPLTIITPHPKEFDRIFGVSANDFARIALAKEKAKQFGCIIVLKGHRSVIAQPDGPTYYNFTGNPGMAKGGSGDVLTGILTALLAQGYQPAQAALFGTFLHGLAGDLASGTYSEEAMLATDLIEHLGQAFQFIASGLIRK